MKNLLAILLTILISSSSNAQIYITTSQDDPELKELIATKHEYKIWPEAPFNGMLIQTLTFKKVVEKLGACNEIREKGLDALPVQPNYNEQKSNLPTYLSIAGISFTIGALITFALVH